MSPSAKAVLAAFAAGCMATFAANHCFDSRALKATKVFADSVATASAAKDSAARARSDSVDAHVARVHKGVSADSATHDAAATALAADTTDRDRVVHLTAIVKADSGQIAGLKNEVASLRWNRDTLLVTVHDLRTANQSLRDRIARLHDTPKWEVWAGRAAIVAATAYGTVKIGKALKIL